MGGGSLFSNLKKSIAEFCVLLTKLLVWHLWKNISRKNSKTRAEGRVGGGGPLDFFLKFIHFGWKKRSSKSCMRQLVTECWQRLTPSDFPLFPLFPLPPTQNIHRHHCHDRSDNDDDGPVKWRWSMQKLSNGGQVLSWLSTWSSPLMESHEDRGERATFVTGLEDPCGSNFCPKVSNSPNLIKEVFWAENVGEEEGAK